MKASSRETRFTVAAFLVLFVGLGVLSVFLLTGESSRARILVEYEADRTASTLADAYRAQGSLDQEKLDPRIKGFALYAQDGQPLTRLGTAPTVLDLGNTPSGFSYEASRRIITLQRVFGVGGPGMMGPGSGFTPGPMTGGGMMGRMMGGGMGTGTWDGPGRFGPPGRSGRFGVGPLGTLHGPAGALFLSMDISAYYRSQTLYEAAAIAAPFAVAGLAAVFLFLLLSNMRHRRRAQEQETLARLGESARTLAHEIRNPLGSIRIQTGLLRKKMPDAASAQLDVIDEEVERLSLLSRRVADFLKNPQGNPQTLVLHEFLSDLVPRLHTPVSYHASSDARGSSVRIDGELLRSVMENLVRNAQESYPEDDGRGDVEISLSRERGSMVIAVKDRGKGIPAELAQKVFDPFFTDKEHGSGVGLPLSRGFIEAAGGFLVLLQRPGGGTEARITLPEKGTR